MSEDDRRGNERS